MFLAELAARHVLICRIPANSDGASLLAPRRLGVWFGVTWACAQGSLRKAGEKRGESTR